MVDDYGDYQIGFHKVGSDTKHGICRRVVKDSSIFECMFISGKRNGFGRYIWSDGAYYIGVFKDGLIHGQGQRVFPDGKIEEG